LTASHACTSCTRYGHTHVDLVSENDSVLHRVALPTPPTMISCVSPLRGANTADRDVHLAQGQLGWLVEIFARRLSPGSTTASNSLRVVASMMTVEQQSSVMPNIARASWLLPSRAVIWLTGHGSSQPHFAHRCPLAGSRDACLGINGRRSQGTRCATLPYMDPTRPASLSPTTSTAHWMMQPHDRYDYRMSPIRHFASGD
jgi:hypothetical protein